MTPERLNPADSNQTPRVLNTLLSRPSFGTGAFAAMIPLNPAGSTR